MPDVCDEIEKIALPFREQLDALYASDEEDQRDFDHFEIREKLETALSESWINLGWLKGVINGAGISWTLDLSYYMLPNPLSDGSTWVLWALWYDDNYNRWQFDDCGLIELGAVHSDRAAYELLKKYAEPGSDKNSIEDCEDLIEGWRCAAEGLPRPKPRHVQRDIEKMDALLDQLSPDRPSERDAWFTNDEMPAILHALVMLAKADDVLHENEVLLLKNISRDLPAHYAYIERVSVMMGSKTIPLFLMKIVGALRDMREAKRVWLAQWLFMMGRIDGVDDPREKDFLAAVFEVMGMGTRTRGIDPLADVWRMQECVHDIVKTWDYAPTWPFMPLNVECLPENGNLDLVNSNGILILWMKLEGKTDLLKLRLGFQDEEYRLSVAVGDEAQESWARASNHAPTFGDIMRLMCGVPQGDPVPRIQDESALGVLLGSGMDVGNWNPKKLPNGGITTRIEFDAAPPAQSRGLFAGLLGKKQRRVLQLCSNYYVPGDGFTRFLKGEVPWSL